jgi:hypothetical protein
MNPRYSWSSLRTMIPTSLAMTRSPPGRCLWQCRSSLGTAISIPGLIAALRKASTSLLGSVSLILPPKIQIGDALNST